MLSDKTLMNEMNELQEVILLKPSNAYAFRGYDALIQSGSKTTDTVLLRRMNDVSAEDVCNLQYTSGTTGNPKAAMLTSR